jgi:hypothetical protein
MLKNYKAVNGQSIYDVCLNTYGTLDRLIKQLVDSGGTARALTTYRPAARCMCTTTI